MNLAHGLRATLPISLALLLGGTCTAFAQEPGQSSLTWDHCRSGGGTTYATFDCSTNTGLPYSLVVSAVLPADVPAFAAAAVEIVAWVEGETLPPWWQTWAGACRAWAVGMAFDPYSLGESQCAEIWHGYDPLQVFQARPRGTYPPSVLFSAGAAVPQGSEFPLIADGSELAIARMTISRTRSVGAGSCAGCDRFVCFGLTNCVLQQVNGPNLWLPGAWWGEAYANARRSSGFSVENVLTPCYDGWVPALNRTWGAIKSLHR